MNTELIRKKRVNILPFISIIFYKFFLDIIYVFIITPNFGYSGFFVNGNIWYYLLSWIVLFLFAFAMVKRINDKKHPSSFIVVLLLYMSLIPFTTMMGFGFFPHSYIIVNLTFLTFLIFFHGLLIKVQVLNRKRLNKNLNSTIIWSISLVFLAIVLFISGKYTGFRFNFNLFEVYELREEASSFNLPGLVSYLYAASKAINPILLVYTLFKKNYSLSVIIVVIQFLSFGIDGSKSAFFMTILSVAIYFLSKNAVLRLIPWLFSGLSLLGILEYHFLNSFNIVNIVIRRVMFVPNMLNYYYYDFFTTFTPDYFKQSFLRNFGFTSSYERIPNMIGSLYFNRPNMAANSGLISDAMTNLGLVGILIIPLILATIFRIFDNCTEGLDKRIYIMSSVYIAYVLISSFTLPALLTHGFIAMFIVLYLLPRVKK